MQAVLNFPVPPDEVQQPARIRLLRGQTGHSVGRIVPEGLPMQIGRESFDPKNLGQIREVQIIIERDAGLDAPGFDAPVSLLRLAHRRGKNPRGRGPEWLFG